jgi:hypothetical protein
MYVQAIADTLSQVIRCCADRSQRPADALKVFLAGAAYTDAVRAPVE